MDWRPTAELAVLRRRAEALAAVRRFFAERDVLEVETPCLADCPVTDPNIEAYACADGYLQTSPEYAMKRLLAAGSGPIWQLARVFRQGERGARHNPEFSLLEWYRPDFALQQLIAEVADLVRYLLGCLRGASPAAALPLQVVSYREIFGDALGLDPHRATAARLEAVARSHIDIQMHSDDPDDWRDLLMSHVVEPALPVDELVAVCDYPASQAALAQVVRDATGAEVAARFELYYRGMELANGYHECRDPQALRRRFERDLGKRAARGQSLPPIDEQLLASTPFMPDSCGVALGFDRLLMLVLDLPRIDDVIPFPR
ncbi:MAG: EF-P lysine aminoacylase EpmA [Spongiibacteraceae bacterium]|nr:EF-P lysine aminoacylase EpmA [Spongiibacteraceae bacterium]